MPIKEENKKRYPADWKDIRARILERAGHRCERCNINNYAKICRGQGDDIGTFMTANGHVYDAETGFELGWRHSSDYCWHKITRVVLTIAHLDHVPENCSEENLQALCQRCHLAYDAEHHATNASITRRKKRAVADMFEAQQ